ncbi:MAG: biotin transporter BioY [Actinobacteria bacterium]|jgi:biotin transport system substrate-specific component|nr:biotin transporter BioY [Actinomycetota bacterium]
MSTPLTVPASHSSQTAFGRRVLADFAPSTRVWDAIVITAAAAFVGLLAQVSYYVPGIVVPFTGQTLGVLLAAGALGTRRGSLSMALYGALGIAGVPWLAGGAAGFPQYTFGYIIGFIAAAMVVGSFAERGWTRTPAGTIATMALGTVTVYAFGVPWLASMLGNNWTAALTSGLVPFVAPDMVKVLIAAALLPSTWALVERKK